MHSVVYEVLQGLHQPSSVRMGHFYVTLQVQVSSKEEEEEVVVTHEWLTTGREWMVYDHHLSPTPHVAQLFHMIPIVGEGTCREKRVSLWQINDRSTPFLGLGRLDQFLYLDQLPAQSLASLRRNRSCSNTGTMNSPHLL